MSSRRSNLCPIRFSGLRQKDNREPTGPHWDRRSRFGPWIAVLNPGAETFITCRPLITEAYDKAVATFNARLCKAR
ncbi:DUF6194 family protein [Allomesorhizobium camelthorni]|uniref:DUF6194 family protein n=1 Tax=Allomesorhizobium camelthorni TaxID=475069 RepID=UPI003CCDE8D3